MSLKNKAVFLLLVLVFSPAFAYDFKKILPDKISLSSSDFEVINDLISKQDFRSLETNDASIAKLILFDYYKGMYKKYIAKKYKIHNYKIIIE